MRLELRQITSAAEVPEVIACYLESFSSPPSGFTPLVAPLIGSGPLAQQDRVMNFSVRLWFSHSADPTSIWFKVVDLDEKDKVVASMRWNIYRENPVGEKLPKPSAFWLEDGPRRTYTEMVLSQFVPIRARRQPHMFIFFTFTHPQYRRCGAGRLLMDWGMNKADELGLETFVEASPLGHELYSKYGFRAERVVELSPAMQSDQIENNEEWTACRQLTSQTNFAILRRPIRGEVDSLADYFPPKGDLSLNKWCGDGTF